MKHPNVNDIERRIRQDAVLSLWLKCVLAILGIVMIVLLLRIAFL